jgi:hypothetical protein
MVQESVPRLNLPHSFLLSSSLHIPINVNIHSGKTPLLDTWIQFMGVEGY